MKKTALYLLIFLTASTLAGSCQEKKEINNHINKITVQDTLTNIKTSFKWQEGLSCPEGYPIQVYRGWLEGPLVSNGVNEKPNSITSISGFGTTTGIGNWGENSSGMSQGEKPIPQRLNCTWYSYVEDIMYEIDTELDYPKMVKLFNEGFQDSNRKRGKVMITYNHITIGFAPGGVVVVWLQEGQKIVEIGRYQGNKIVISPKEIASLDSHERLLFDPVDRERTLKNPKIIAPEVQEANKNKPIPYGLWDSYRIKYCWRPVSIFVREGKVQDELSFTLFNGERETLLGEEFNKNEYQERAIPKSLGLGYWDKNGQGYSGSFIFDEKEIFAAFKELYKKNPEASIDLEVKLNPGSTYLGATLKNEINAISLKKSKTEVYESRSLTKEYRYNWRPVFVFAEGAKIPDNIDIRRRTLQEVLKDKAYTNISFQQNSSPSMIVFNYYERDSFIGATNLIFEEVEIAQTFKNLDKLNPGAPLEMEIKTGKTPHSFSITLKGNGKEIPIKFIADDWK
ncbi:DUF2931 domain-containing protein [Flavobacterium sp. WLB]|uniref:DUF2931 family protein n=1 Tax=unclassified Flavobacterium TaxID=196869 RepID=UPI0006AB835C|nr:MULTISPECIES: DUF2931 family protein [unclassified Flavobacterium]KOP39807.1 hypothetical protein AKO67_02680 [Flavobacterium sp. VMW]OWU92595.1 hypothetical protein APR43_00600 [Flavobacterium sp. NLM]PUU67847.1 DUF2931 domain-containing protein [Flavobacterium sp. WLB]